MGRLAMSQISTSSVFRTSIHDVIEEHHHEKSFSIPFNEYDVLQLQAIFVQPGIHVIKTKNIVDGRKVITTILNSLNYYHNIGCITDINGLSDEVYDIVAHLQLRKYQHENSLVDLEDFFAIYPCFDFIWIEYGESIEKKYALQDIKKIFNMFHVEERMPVLVVKYDENLSELI